MFDLKTEQSEMFGLEMLSLEMLSDAFLEQLEGIRRVMDEFSADFSARKEGSIEESDEEDEEEEETEYAEVYGASKEDLKKYVEKFNEYARSIKKGVEEIYGGEAENGKKQDERKTEDLGMKSPHERGHKPGCGCPGCSAYREFFGIKVERGKVFQSGLGTVPDAAFAAKRKDAGKYEEASSKPCGGRLYNFFHGEHAELKNILGKYTGGFNFGRAGY